MKTKTVLDSAAESTNELRSQGWGAPWWRLKEGSFQVGIKQLLHTFLLYPARTEGLVYCLQRGAVETSKG